MLILKCIFSILYKGTGGVAPMFKLLVKVFGCLYLLNMWINQVDTMSVG